MIFKPLIILCNCPLFTEKLMINQVKIYLLNYYLNNKFKMHKLLRTSILLLHCVVINAKIVFRTKYLKIPINTLKKK